MMIIFSIDLYCTKCNTFILKCLIQFTCTNLDGCQKEGGNFFNLLQKKGGTQKGGRGFPQKRGWGPTLKETMGQIKKIPRFSVANQPTNPIF